MPSPRRSPKKPLRARKAKKRFDPADFLAKTGIGKTIQGFRPKQVIFSQGDPADAVFYIREGRVRLRVVSKQGKEATIGLLSAGEFLGEGCIASDHPVRLAGATAITDCVVLRIDRDQMLRTLHAESKFSDMFVAYAIDRHNRTQADLVDQLFNSSEKRLARALLILARFGKEDTPETVTPNVSQETLAEMIGTTRSRVNFFMNRFRKLGFIDYNGELQVRTSLLSVVLHD
jgi:CRP/FNR family transcriptional regulator, cyclic AMP receptor protein